MGNKYCSVTINNDLIIYMQDMFCGCHLYLGLNWVNSLCPRVCVKLKCMRKKDDVGRGRGLVCFLKPYILLSRLCPRQISLSKDRENVFFSTFRWHMQLIEAVGRILLPLVVSHLLCAK
jgi:hypothetical protein